MTDFKGYPDWAWEFDSRAVMASNGSTGAVLWYVGPHLEREIKEYGLSALNDLGLDDAPRGLSVWEGKFMPRYLLAPDDGTDPHGQFRPLTQQEIGCVLCGVSPWSQKEWIEEKKKEWEAREAACRENDQEGSPKST